MNQAKILARSERMGTCRGDCGLGCHTRMAHQMRAGERREVVPRSNLGRGTSVFVEVDRLPHRQQVVTGVIGQQPRANCVGGGRRFQHRVVGAYLHCGSDPQLAHGRRLELGPRRTGATAVDAELAPPVRHRRREHRHAGRFRPALRHANQDRHHQCAQLPAQLGLFHE